MDNKVNEEITHKKNSHVWRNIVIFVLFLAMGIGIGVYGTTKYLESKENDEVEEQETKKDEWPEDITDSQQTKELVNLLYLMLNKDSLFYNSKGVEAANFDNKTKLSFIYKYIENNKLGTNDKLVAVETINSVCDFGFLVDVLENADDVSTTCSILRIKRDVFLDVNKKIFNSETLEMGGEILLNDGKKCVIDTNDNVTYMCGNVLNENAITGEIESKFTIQKVMREEDGTIFIYEKGYLIDKRSNIVNSDSTYDNYYLHSVDSTNHYFELKNADNLTFKHTFKTKDKLNYYYEKTELVKE